MFELIVILLYATGGVGLYDIFCRAFEGNEGNTRLLCICVVIWPLMLLQLGSARIIKRVKKWI